MAILHKYLQYNWNNGFQTNNAILSTTPYEPEVIFIGTFNHGWSWNAADFFYGRGMYMWTILGNLFLNDRNVFTESRIPLPGNNTPSLNQIFEICKNGKIVFADIVTGTNVNIPVHINLAAKSVLVNNQYVWSGYKDGPLDIMGANDWLDDNTQNIITYINQTPSIRHIYFTFKSGAWLVSQMNTIIEGVNPKPCHSIFTPTGNGFRKNLQPPYDERAWSIAHCWVWNNLPNVVPINKIGYSHLDHQWLISHGVTPTNF